MADDDGLNGNVRGRIDQEGSHDAAFADDELLLDSSSLVIQYVPLAIILLLAGTWYNQKLKRARTGRHKKVDDTNPC